MPHLGPNFPKHIAAGCLIFGKEDSRLSKNQWELPQLGQWQAFTRHDCPLPASADSGRLVPRIELLSPLGTLATDIPSLPQEIQSILLKFALAPIAKLFRHHWIELEVAVASSSDGVADAAIVRVYLLPDDVDRRLVNRSSGELRKSWNRLLQRLDFSQSTWQGRLGGRRTSQPRPRNAAAENDGEDEDVSLLHIFNTIPSPDPQPQLLVDSYDRECSYSLLDSKIAGLTSTLYPHQRRSAALMLQREVQPSQVLDPRLSTVIDQNGATWYYDEASGTALKEPRFYDGICGGILAEEMGAGKTLICLALILATRHQPAYTPEIYMSCPVTRPKIGSLADMAASAGNRASVPWGAYFDDFLDRGLHYNACLEVIARNPAGYWLPRPAARRTTRQPPASLPELKIMLSRATLVVVPTNLLQQWKDEIAKHTAGLRVFIAAGKGEIPGPEELLQYELILFSISRFERLREKRVADQNGVWMLDSPIAGIRFKRVIVDEGHRLGNSKIGKKSEILLILDHIQASAKWIVTGTPSTGLFGVDDNDLSPVREKTSALGSGLPMQSAQKHMAGSSEQERKDLERIGSIASLYLNARPWANGAKEAGDTPAEWSVYVMNKKHNNRGRGCHSVLRSTLESLIIRHRRTELGDMFPSVREKVVYLDGSYQDRLALNLFSMMIIFNQVQSQRTDRDFFFHPSQRKSLLQLVSNEKQATFFGGSFFTKMEVLKAVETAENFIKEKKVPVTEEEERLLLDAIVFGKLAATNRLKDAAGRFHEVPVYVEELPGKDFDRVSQSWSIDEVPVPDGPSSQLVCTDAPMIMAMQRFVRPWLRSPEALDIVFRSGTFAQKGEQEKRKFLGGGPPDVAASSGATLAGNTKLGDGATMKKSRPGQHGVPVTEDEAGDGAAGEEIAEPLARTRLVSTASAKLSYLLDSILKYQEDEKILLFYESENVAYWIAEFLEILRIGHLIYAKSLSAERRAQYIATFNGNPTFRVMLMDLTQAAFGLDMRSASRIYFISPVLNPQVQAQAIGRVRRISQKKEVSVETLVLRGSLEEMIVERREKMTQAEHRKCKSLLDDRPLYEWFMNAKILPLPEGDPDGPVQMAPLSVPLALFGYGAGKIMHPDEGLVIRSNDRAEDGSNGSVATGAKRPFSAASDVEGDAWVRERKAKRQREGRVVRFADPGGDE